MSDDWQRFPTDEITLRLLTEACRINEDTGRTHLDDFLHMGTRLKSAEEGGVTYGSVDEALADSLAETPLVYVEYEPGFEPHSPQTVIISLVEESQRLRAVSQPEASGEAGTVTREAGSEEPS